MKKIFLLFIIFLSANTYAVTLQSSDSKLISEKGIQIYSNAIFVNGNKDIGFRFASNKSPEEVQNWYQKQLPNWALYKEYGGWILYDGTPGKGMAGVMSENQVMVKHNDNLPGWFSLEKDMTTEIVIMIVK